MKQVVIRLHSSCFRDFIVDAIKSSGGRVDPEGNPTTIWAVLPQKEIDFMAKNCGTEIYDILVSIRE